MLLSICLIVSLKEQNGNGTSQVYVLKVTKWLYALKNSKWGYKFSINIHPPPWKILEEGLDWTIYIMPFLAIKLINLSYTPPDLIPRTTLEFNWMFVASLESCKSISIDIGRHLMDMLQNLLNLNKFF